MAAPLLMKYGVIDYSLTYNLTSDRRLLRDITHGKAQLLDEHDCVCTITFPSYLHLARFMSDPEGKELTKDHENFMDEGGMKVAVGDEYVIVKEGERVDE